VREREASRATTAIRALRGALKSGGMAAGVASNDRTGPPEAKASAFNSTVGTLQAMLSPSAFQRVLLRLPRETAQLIEHRPLPLEWIAAERYGDLIGAALDEAFDGDEDRVIDVGRRMIVADLKMIHRMFIKLLSPQHVIDRAPRIWLAYNRNNGFLSVERLGDDSCEVHYQGVRAIYPGHWAYQRGIILGVIEATGYRQVGAQIVRGGRRDHEMVLHTSWAKRRNSPGSG
jgi:uncharacterized protein (TIGR02265 family)